MIEKVVLDYLSSNVTEAVSMEVDKTMPEEFWDATFDMYEEGLKASAIKVKESDVEDIIKWLDKIFGEEEIPYS